MKKIFARLFLMKHRSAEGVEGQNEKSSGDTSIKQPEFPILQSIKDMNLGFQSEMLKIYNFVLEEIILRQGNNELAHQIILESINRIEQYLGTDEMDRYIYNLLSKYNYQAACYCNKTNDLSGALLFFKASLNAQTVCFNVTNEISELHELAFCYLKLGEQYHALGVKIEAFNNFHLAQETLQDAIAANYSIRRFQTFPYKRRIDSAEDDLEALQQVMTQLGY